MSEEEYISALQARWPRNGDASFETIALADQAVRDFPSSARLHLMRGNLIELGPESCPHSLKEALHSYERAAEIDPYFADAWEEIAHFYDAALGNRKAAMNFFQKAEKLRNAWMFGVSADIQAPGFPIHSAALPMTFSTLGLS